LASRGSLAAWFLFLRLDAGSNRVSDRLQATFVAAAQGNCTFPPVSGFPAAGGLQRDVGMVRMERGASAVEAR